MYVTDKAKPMAETGLLIKIFGWIGPVFLGLSLIDGLTKFQSAVLFTVGLIMIIVRFAFAVDRWIQDHVRRSQENKMRDQQIRQKGIELDERELEIIRRK